MGFFDPPELRRQKRAAKDAQRLREMAAREATTELEMLARRYNFARGVRDEAYSSGNTDTGHALSVAMDAARDILDRADQFANAFELERDVMRRPIVTADYAALVSLELEGRTALSLIRDQARSNLSELGGIVAEQVLTRARAEQQSHSTT